MPAGFEVQCQTAAEVVVQEGHKPYASDRYNGSVLTVWTVPMIATPYAGPIYPPFHGEVAVGGVVSAAIKTRRVAPGALRPASGPVRIASPQPVQYADTICLPGGVFLQLYTVHDIADPQSIWSNAIRYLRYESGVAVTDVMLSPYTPLPT
jgi:hypothetical protein